MRTRFAVGLLALGPLVLAAFGCSGGAVFYCPDDPAEIGYNDPGCVEGRAMCTDPKDARYCQKNCKDWRLKVQGKESPECVDGGVSQGPGSNPQGALCLDAGGECLPLPGGPAAPYFSERPELVYIGALGPDGELAATCPPNADTERDRLFADLDMTTHCDACACEPPEGACTELPAAIEVRAGQCGELGAASLPFDGSAGWDGSCTAENALTEGAECPAGSGELCAQSVSISALLPPVEKPCAVRVEPVPSFTPPAPEWKTGLLACGAASPAADATCKDDGNGALCVIARGLPFVHCLRRPGVHNECPANYDALGPRVFYSKNAVVPGKCSECACGEPKGGECLGAFRVYSDPACNNQLFESLISSVTGQCTNFQMPGPPVGSKAITDIERMPGQCEAMGGEPLADPYPDADQAVTFCCRPLFDFIEG